jgi:hypothetical protein
VKKSLVILGIATALLSITPNNSEASLREVKSSQSMEWAIDDTTIKWRGDEWFTAEVHTLLNGSSVEVNFYTFEYLPEYKNWYYNIKGSRVYSNVNVDGMEKAIDIAEDMRR